MDTVRAPHWHMRKYLKPHQTLSPVSFHLHYAASQDTASGKLSWGRQGSTEQAPCCSAWGWVGGTPCTCTHSPPRLSHRCQFLQNTEWIIFMLLLPTSQFLGVMHLGESLIFYLQRKEKMSKLNLRDGGNSHNPNIIKVQTSKAIKKILFIFLFHYFFE